MGRKRKSDTQKEREGTLRGDRKKESIQVNLLTKKPQVPTYFSEEAKSIFRRVLNYIYPLNYLAPQDLPILESYCLVLEAKKQAVEDLNERGYVIQFVTAKGEESERTNSYVKVLKDSIEQEIKLSARLGLSPSDRANVSAAINEEEEENEMFD
jgi:P27 family predicted phage terminase small subunit